MKAVLALVVIYLVMFLVAIQGGSSAPVQAAAQNTTKQSNTSQIDPAKDADIRALIELVGARDQIQDSITTSAEQYREKLLATVPNNDKGQAFVNSVISEYEKNYDLDDVIRQLVAIFDKHYTDDEIKGLLQFYGTPFGQKVAAEQPKIAREAQEAMRSTPSRPCARRSSMLNRKTRGSDRTRIWAARRRTVLASSAVGSSQVVRRKPPSSKIRGSFRGA